MRRRNNKNKQIAKKLRKSLTEAERLLWSYLRNRQLGVKFRRQEPIGKYIVDFVSYEVGLVIELDGGQHVESRGFDLERDRELGRLGFKVLRFWNNEVMTNIEGVLEVIRREVDNPPPLNPLSATQNPSDFSREGRSISFSVSRLPSTEYRESP